MPLFCHFPGMLQHIRGSTFPGCADLDLGMVLELPEEQSYYKTLCLGSQMLVTTSQTRCNKSSRIYKTFCPSLQTFKGKDDKGRH